jgi:glycerophosphoryl diester phosphodiesterase
MIAHRLLRSSLVLAAVLAGCGESSVPVSQGPVEEPPPQYDGPKVSAHQGGYGYAPDGTMAAFVNAVRLGVDEIETDTFLMADGRLVLLHDETLDRTTDCSGDVSTLASADVADCDAAYWWSPGQPDTREREGVEYPLRGQGIRLAFADELFAYVASLGERGPRINIEIKIDSQQLLATRTAAAIVELIQEYELHDRVVVQSFLPTSLDLVKLNDPSVRVSFLAGRTGATSCNLAALLSIARGYEILSPEFAMPDLNESCVRLAQAAGLEVLPWTIDREEDLTSLIGLGVDGIITNYPACLLRLLGRPVPAQVVTPLARQPAGFPLCLA